MHPIPIRQFAAPLHHILLTGVEHVVRAKGRRVLFPHGAELGNDDLGAAAGAQGLDDGEPDGAPAEDEDRVGLFVLGDIDCVPADGEGLDEGGDVETYL